MLEGVGVGSDEIWRLRHERLTPELSRPAERARRWDNLSASAETAKRARLERIVRRVTPMNSVCRDLQAKAPG